MPNQAFKLFAFQNLIKCRRFDISGAKMGSTGRASLLEVAEKEVDFTVFSLSWIPSSARLVVSGASNAGAGLIKVFSLGGRDLSETGSANLPRAIRCGTFDVCDLTDRVYCCGDFSGSLVFWDIETLLQVDTVKAHSDIVNTIAGGGIGSSEVVTGGRDGEVKLWDRRTLEKPILRMSPGETETKRDCWSVSHSGPDSKLVAAGFDNGDIKVFDVRATKLLWETSLSRGVSNLNLVQGSTPGLVAGTVQGKLFKWKISSGDSTQSTQLDKSTVWSTEMIKDGTLVSCMGSGALCVTEYNKDGLECVNTHQISEPPLTGLATSSDKPGLFATSSFDKSIRIYFYTGAK